MLIEQIIEFELRGPGHPAVYIFLQLIIFSVFFFLLVGVYAKNTFIIIIIIMKKNV